MSLHATLTFKASYSTTSGMSSAPPRVYNAAATHFKATNTAIAHATTRNEMAKDVDQTWG